jgi:transcription antitermination factor NusG
MHSCLSLKGLVSEKRGKNWSVSPLLPGYLFVYIRMTYEEMLAVLKAYGIVRFIGVIPGEPEPVPDEQIVSLKKLV